MAKQRDFILHIHFRQARVSIDLVFELFIQRASSRLRDDFCSREKSANGRASMTRASCETQNPGDPPNQKNPSAPVHLPLESVDVEFSTISVDKTVNKLSQIALSYPYQSTFSALPILEAIIIPYKTMGYKIPIIHSHLVTIQ